VDKNGDKLIKTLNGSPNDGMEGAFNTYHSQYLEIYEQDADRAQPTDQSLPTADVALWASELQGWHDYSVHLRSLPPIEGPAGLTVDRTDSTHNTVSWYTVYDANSYTVQKQALTNPPSTWSNVSGCSSTTNTQCQDLSSTGTEYAYRVQAVGSQYSSAWSYVGVFLSESTSTTNYDGYVELKNGIKTPKNAAGQPGIRAGEGNTMMGVFPYWRGIVSFNTSLLGSTTTILGAKLRLNQATPGTYFGTGGLGTCMVDTKKGHFGNSLALEGMDYDSTDWTTQNAFPVVNVGQYNWFDAYLSTTAAQANIANTDHTQFRIYFNQGPANKNEGWYSGETNTSTPSTPPHLIVQYQQ